MSSDPITWEEVDTYFQTRRAEPGAAEDAETAKAHVLSFIKRSDEITHEGMRLDVLRLIARNAGDLITGDLLKEEPTLPRAFLDKSTLSEKHQQSLKYEEYEMQAAMFELRGSPNPSDTHPIWDWPTDIQKSIRTQMKDGMWEGLDEGLIEPLSRFLSWEASICRKLLQEPRRRRRAQARGADKFLPTQPGTTGTETDGAKTAGTSHVGQVSEDEWDAMDIEETDDVRIKDCDEGWTGFEFEQAMRGKA